MNNKQEVTGNYIAGLWSFFASVKLTVVVLLTLAALSIIGTLIPQNENPSAYFQAFGPFLFHVMDTLDIFDMYRSWWFQGLIVLMVINIVVCSIDRLQTTGKVIFTKTPKFNLERYRGHNNRQDFTVSANKETCRDTYHRWLAKRYGYCQVIPVGEGYAIFAEKGRWTRLGVYAVHLSIVILLSGALIGSINGYEGYVNIPEGESINTIQLRYSGQAFQLPFEIRCEDFDVQFYKSGAPKEFRSKLVLIENGEPVLEKNVIVNDPIRYKGINIFQSSYGKMKGGAPIETGADDEIELSLKSKSSGMIYSQKARLNQTVSMPEGAGTFVITDYSPAAKFKGMDIGPAFSGTLTPDQGDTVSIVLPLKFPRFDAMRGGDFVISVQSGGDPQPDRYYTGLQITRDPGVGLVYSGFILMIIGCMVTFFMAHRQIVLELQSKGNHLNVMVSGKSNKNKVGMHRYLEVLAGKLVVLNVSGNKIWKM